MRTSGHRESSLAVQQQAAEPARPAVSRLTNSAFVLSGVGGRISTAQKLPDASAVVVCCAVRRGCWHVLGSAEDNRITYLLQVPRSSTLGLQYACGRASRAARTKEFAFSHLESMADILTNCRDGHVQYSKVR